MSSASLEHVYVRFIIRNCHCWLFGTMEQWTPQEISRFSLDPHKCKSLEKGLIEHSRTPQGVVCGSRYCILTEDLYQKGQFHGSGKVHSWNTCTKSMGAVAKKLGYIQKRDNWRSTVAAVYIYSWRYSGRTRLETLWPGFVLCIQACGCVTLIFYISSQKCILVEHSFNLYCVPVLNNFS